MCHKSTLSRFFLKQCTQYNHFFANDREHTDLKQSWKFETFHTLTFYGLEDTRGNLPFHYLCNPYNLYTGLVYQPKFDSSKTFRFNIFCYKNWGYFKVVMEESLMIFGVLRHTSLQEAYK